MGVSTVRVYGAPPTYGVRHNVRRWMGGLISVSAFAPAQTQTQGCCHRPHHPGPGWMELDGFHWAATLLAVAGNLCSLLTAAMPALASPRMPNARVLLPHRELCRTAGSTEGRNYFVRRWIFNLRAGAVPVLTRLD